MTGFDQSEMDRQVGFLWREVRRGGWIRALDLTVSWSAPSEAAAEALRAHLAAEHRLRLVGSDHLGADASVTTVSARLHLPDPSVDVLRARLEWALDVARGAGAKVVGAGVGAHED